MYLPIQLQIQIDGWIPIQGDACDHLNPSMWASDAQERNVYRTSLSVKAGPKNESDFHLKFRCSHWHYLIVYCERNAWMNVVWTLAENFRSGCIGASGEGNSCVSLIVRWEIDWTDGEVDESLNMPIRLFADKFNRILPICDMLIRHERWRESETMFRR